MGNIKYAIYTNKVYQAIFNENANEYRKILKLDSKENIRHTMYSEILALIAGFENGVADMIEQEYLKIISSLLYKIEYSERIKIRNFLEH